MSKGLTLHLSLIFFTDFHGFLTKIKLHFPKLLWKNTLNFIFSIHLMHIINTSEFVIQLHYEQQKQPFIFKYNLKQFPNRQWSLRFHSFLFGTHFRDFLKLIFTFVILRFIVKIFRPFVSKLIPLLRQTFMLAINRSTITQILTPIIYRYTNIFPGRVMYIWKKCVDE